MKNINFRAPDETADKLERIRQRRGFLNDSETLRWIISEMAIRELDNYKTIARERLAKSARTPEEIAKAKLDLEAAATREAEVRALQVKTNICNTLGGEVVDRDGVPYCVYKSYEQDGQESVAIREEAEPLERMNSELPTLQYRLRTGVTGEVAKEWVKKVLIKKEMQSQA